MKNFIVAVCLIALSFTATAQIPHVKFIEKNSGKEREGTVAIAQFQISIPCEINPTTGLPVVKSDKEHTNKIDRCLDIAAENHSKIIVFPELTTAMDKAKREKLINSFREFSRKNDAIIIAGTFYDEERRGLCPVVFPDTVCYSYKIRPSVFESSVYADRGMTGTDTLCIYRTKYGKIAPLVCVDLISDDANYLIRRLSNHGEIDLLFSVCYNPASREFLREASAIVNRHPLFAVIANVATGPGAENKQKNDSEYGFSGVLGSLQYAQKSATIKNIPECLKNCAGKLHDSYENIISVIEPGHEAALLYEINLSVIRVPQNTNAPDQGYPTIKNIEQIPIP